MGLVIHELVLKSNWRLIAQRTVPPALIVPALDSGKELLLGSGVTGGEVFPDYFVFGFADGAFHPSVIIGIARPAHTAHQPVAREKLAGVGAGVLYAAVQMDDQAFEWVALGHGHRQCGQHQFAET